MIVREMSAHDCTALIASGRLARLACSRSDRPYVVPIYYVYADSCAYAFTMPGRKLDTMRANPNAALLVETGGDGRLWKSVVAEGVFEELPERIGYKREREHAWSLLSQHANWWEPGALKPQLHETTRDSAHAFFRIRVERMSGREAVAD
jgi:nitroimidazol reductase NimA-like FMN-containing flavoprotein (pyridoxamine 5'-phosphate oxidase superfamily)